jgi:hypothetical protein
VSVLKSSLPVSLFAFAILLCGVAVSFAGIVAIHDWDSTGAGAWSSSNGWAVVTDATSGGNTGRFLSITFTNTPDEDPPPDSWRDLIYTPATSLYAGTYSVSNWFAFDFWAEDVLPNALQVRWGSTNSDHIWGAEISGPTATGDWQTLRSPGLANWEDWAGVEPFGSDVLFREDLKDISWVGLYIDRNTAVEQMYGVDNFALMVPEPAELIMLASALLAVFLAYRRKEQQA